MAKDGIKAAVHAELFHSRANLFRGAALRGRLLEDFQKDPGLLGADTAFVIMAALCAAEEAGVNLDLDEAVAAGRELFDEFMQQVHGSA